MNIFISKKLKEFRKEHGNTQEELSNHLGISVQAVSKWERGEGYPDITLLPSIAFYYNKTVDELLGCGELEKNKKIEKITEQYAANGHAGKIEDNIALMREALKKFPNNLTFMSNLAHSLFFIGQETYLDECIELCEKILARSTDDTQRYAALQTITLSYSKKNRMEKAKEYAEKLPDLYCTKNILLESVLDGQERLMTAQTNIITLVNLINNSVAWMLRSKEYTSEEKIFAYETVDRLYQLFLYDENYGYEHSALHLLWMNLSKEYAACKNKEKTVLALKTAYRYAYKIDHFQSGKYTSMFANTGGYSKEGFWKNFETSYIDWLKKTMQEPIFDFIRKTDEFQQMIPSCE